MSFEFEDSCHDGDNFQKDDCGYGCCINNNPGRGQRGNDEWENRGRKSWDYGYNDGKAYEGNYDTSKWYDPDFDDDNSDADYNGGRARFNKNKKGRGGSGGNCGRQKCCRKNCNSGCGRGSVDFLILLMLIFGLILVILLFARFAACSRGLISAVV